MEDGRPRPSQTIKLDTPAKPSPTAPLRAEVPAHPPPQTPARSRHAAHGHKHTGPKEPLRHRTSPQPAPPARPGFRPAANPQFANQPPLRESQAIPRVAPQPIPPAPTSARRITPASAEHAAQS